MPKVQFGDFSCTLGEGESVLDGLLRAGAPLAYACKSGACGSCLLRATEGQLPPGAQQGLRDSWQLRGYFLPCVCHPETDITADLAGNDARAAASIASLQPLSADVLCVRLRCDKLFDFRAGQYITLLRPDGLARSYSIASLPEDGELELHVRRVTNGKMSHWLFAEARPGDTVIVQGPSGDCFYVEGNADAPMLLVGAGTGLAPLWGIVRDALRQGHRGPIHLIHGAVRPAGLYLRSELAALAVRHPNFRYLASVLNSEGSSGTDDRDIEAGPIDQLLARRFGDLTGWRGYVCGDPALVQAIRKKLFLAGIAMRDIYADAFLPSAS